MKKILTLLALMVATVAAFAAFAANRTQARSMEENDGVLTYEQSLFCQGGWMFGDTPIETKKVTMTVTEDENGTYDFNFPDLHVETKSMGNTKIDGGLTIKGVAAKKSESGYTTYSKDLGEGGTNMTLHGVAYGDKIYVKMEGTFMYMANCVLVYGTEIVAPEEPEPGVSATTYKDKASSLFKENTTNFDEAEVEVAEAGEGAYNFVAKQVRVASNVIADFTMPSVAGTKNADGSISYSYNGAAKTTGVSVVAGYLGFTEGGDASVKMNGKSKDGKLYMTLEFTANGSDAVYTFGEKIEGTEPENPDPGTPDVEGTVVGTDGYAPAGEKFAWDAAIDWNTQKLVAAIDVTGCTGTNEDILSLGSNIDSWAGVHFHLYYTRSNNTLQVNYLDLEKGNTVRKDVVVAGDELLIEISKAAGLTVNGESMNYLNESGELTEDYENVYKELWALTNVTFGSQEGGGRSHATYKYVRIQNIASEPAFTAETFTDNMSVTEPGAEAKKTEDKQLDINTYNDGTYGVTIHNVEGATENLGDITLKGLEKTEADGVTKYTAEALTATVNGKDMTATVAGVKYADGKVWFKFTFVTAEQTTYVVEFGKEQKPARQFAEGHAYKGTWNVYIPTEEFDGTVDVIEQEDGLFALRVHGYKYKGKVTPTFVIPDLNGTKDGNSVSINEMRYVLVTYEAGAEAGDADAKRVRYFGFISVATEDGDIRIDASYVGFEGTEEECTSAKFIGSDNASGINGINAANNGKAEIFTTTGAKVNAMQKGINLVRKDGKTVKVVKK